MRPIFLNYDMSDQSHTHDTMTFVTAVTDQLLRLQALYRSTSCSDADVTAALQCQDSPQKRAVSGIKHAAIAPPIEYAGGAAFALGVPQPPQHGATDARFRPSATLSVQYSLADKKLSAAAKTLVRAISVHPLPASVMLPSHGFDCAGPFPADRRAPAQEAPEDSRPPLQLTKLTESAFAAAAEQPAVLTDVGEDAAMPPLRLAMPSESGRGRPPAEAEEPGTPTRIAAGAAAEEPQEQGSAESYNSEQGFGSPVRKRHGACADVPGAVQAPKTKQKWLYEEAP